MTATAQNSTVQNSLLQSITIRCVLQARLGGLDRVLNAFTHRGYLPRRFLCEQDPQGQRLVCDVTIDYTPSPSVGDTELEKLVKFLNKQVLILQAEITQPESTAVHNLVTLHATKPPLI